MSRYFILSLAGAALLSGGALGAFAATARADQHAHDQGKTHDRSQGRECFFLSSVSGFSHAGRNQIYVHTGPRDTYLFRTLGPCPDLDFGESIGFDQTGGGTICHGIDVDLIVPSQIGPQRCPVDMIRKLAPGEKAVRRRSSQ